MARQSKQEKLWLSFLASWALLIPALVLSMRVRVMCAILQLKPFEYLPLSGDVHGFNPHAFYRIMHDLTHPIPLVGYSAVMIYLATRPIARPVNERLHRFVSLGLPWIHFALFAVYSGSMFLPIVNCTQIISPAG